MKEVYLVSGLGWTELILHVLDEGIWNQWRKGSGEGSRDEGVWECGSKRGTRVVRREVTQ